MPKPIQFSILRMLCATTLFSVGIAVWKASWNHDIRVEFCVVGLCCFGAGVGALFVRPFAAAIAVLILVLAALALFSPPVGV
jgi:hypothetical protein